MNRAEKKQVIEQLTDRAKDASIALVTDFRGLKVEEMETLRGRLREAGVHYQVVKNTLAQRALQGGPHEVIKDEFGDCCALALGYDDPVVATKVLTRYAKENKKFNIRFGSYEGKALSAEDIEALSKLPGREQLLSMFVGTLNAVPGNFVGLFANMLRNMLYALNAIKEQKEQSQA
ncbi:MAG: 50S ribosomal protein L10 [Desulfovermiculus sp.]|nr:50S ribosomal protein L10 [Desulfovermiculus sp.]